MENEEEGAGELNGLESQVESWVVVLGWWELDLSQGGSEMVMTKKAEGETFIGILYF